MELIPALETAAGAAGLVPGWREASALTRPGAHCGIQGQAVPPGKKRRSPGWKVLPGWRTENPLWRSEC